MTNINNPHWDFEENDWVPLCRCVRQTAARRLCRGDQGSKHAWWWKMLRFSSREKAVQLVWNGWRTQFCDSGADKFIKFKIRSSQVLWQHRFCLNWFSDWKCSRCTAPHWHVVKEGVHVHPSSAQKKNEVHHNYMNISHCSTLPAAVTVNGAATWIQTSDSIDLSALHPLPPPPIWIGCAEMNIQSSCLILRWPNVFSFIVQIVRGHKGVTLLYRFYWMSGPPKHPQSRSGLLGLWACVKHHVCFFYKHTRLSFAPTHVPSLTCCIIIMYS